MADPQPVIVTVAPTGPLTTREQHPGVPLTPAEIGVAVAEAAEAGAAVARIHARDDRGVPTADRPAAALQLRDGRPRRYAVGSGAAADADRDAPGRRDLAGDRHRPRSAAADLRCARRLGGNVRVGLEDNV
jgi:uncharacterized protein (DUF849 family)